MARASETRTKILRAAEEVVVRDGVAHLTLEAAAAEAGLSKGGVLYHFPSRAALVTAMVGRFVESFEADLVRYGAGTGEPGAFTRAYVLASIAPADSEREQRLGSALLAGMASDPQLLAPLRAQAEAWQAAVERDGLAPGTGTLVRLAADGMWLADVLGIAPIEGAARERVAAMLQSIATPPRTRGPRPASKTTFVR